MRCAVLLAVFALTAVLCPLTSGFSAIFTNNALLSETNTSFDGQDIIVSGATLTVDGPHVFNSLLLTNGAVLTHSLCATTNTHKLDLTVCNAVVVSASRRIAVSGFA